MGSSRFEGYGEGKQERKWDPWEVFQNTLEYHNLGDPKGEVIYQDFMNPNSTLPNQMSNTDSGMLHRKHFSGSHKLKS